MAKKKVKTNKKQVKNADCILINPEPPTPWETIKIKAQHALPLWAPDIALKGMIKGLLWVRRKTNFRQFKLVKVNFTSKDWPTIHEDLQFLDRVAEKYHFSRDEFVQFAIEKGLGLKQPEKESKA